MPKPDGQATVAKAFCKVTGERDANPVVLIPKSKLPNAEIGTKG